MTAVLTDGFDEQAIAVLAVAPGVGRREAPVLAFRCEFVGRGSDAASRDVEGAVCPEIGTELVCGEREIVVESDRETPIKGPLLRAAKLQVDLPLHVLHKHDGAPVFSTECERFAGIRIAIRRGPVCPYPNIGIPLMNVAVERSVEGEFLQQIALARTKRVELVGAYAIAEKLHKEQLEEAELQSRHAFVFHERSAAESGDFMPDPRGFEEIAGAAAAREFVDALDVEV